MLVIPNSIPRSHGGVIGGVSELLWNLDVSPEMLTLGAMQERWANTALQRGVLYLSFLPFPILFHS